MRIIGIVLILLGIAGFMVEAISWTTSEEVLDVGPMEVERQEEKTVPITPIAAGAAVVGGIVLVVIDSRREGG
jgi:uncharacterized membrane protein YidH (DUF202 family)